MNFAGFEIFYNVLCLLKQTMKNLVNSPEVVQEEPLSQNIACVQWYNKEEQTDHGILTDSTHATITKTCYANIQKISSPKTESFQIKILIFFTLLLKT